jgi:hypothetical protein
MGISSLGSSFQLVDPQFWKFPFSISKTKRPRITLGYLALNALPWITSVNVPAEGVASTVTDEDMQQNLDPKEKK